MAKTKKKKNLKGVLYLTLTAVLVYFMVINGLRIYKQQQVLLKLQETKIALEGKKDKLSKEVKNLEDDEYVVRYARENYIFSKEGEAVVKLPEVKK